MTSSAVLLLFSVLAAASAAPWPASVPRCSSECPVAGSPKLAYVPGHTYTYSYTGKSHLHLRDAEGANSDTEWSAQVSLAWLSPCDMAITVMRPSFGGSSGSPKSQVLERYPLMVSVIDGRMEHACNHPDDEVWSINMKKGIASAFQNSLPSISSMNTGLNFTETDIIGNCSTMYKVENQGEKVIVEKIKNHRFCQDYYVDRAESRKVWPKSPIPMEESMSECKQEITKGIYSSITCEDRKIVRPVYGAYRYIEAKHESVLRFQSKSENLPQAVTTLRGHLVRKTLRYDQKTLNKDSSMVAKVDEALKEVCEKTKDRAEPEAAKEVAKALHYLRQIPEKEIPKTLEKIRSGQICAEKQKLESIFLDALAFVHESGAVKVMVQELISGRAKAGRSALYAAALYLMPRPCMHSIQELKPLFENFQRFPRTTMAAASMVNTYCRLNPRCHEKAEVKELVQALSSKISSLCSQPASEESRQEALLLLKAIGNMGVITSEIANPLIQCIEKEEADRSIRMTATEAFRNVKCNREFREPRKHLVNIVVNPRIDTEARIGSYLAAIRCADYMDIRKITDEMWREHNTQVRGFILSHLLNIQESTAPYKQNLKYLMTNIVLPSNFTTDMRKYSRNIDISYYAPTFGLGAGMESNILYAPGSFLPRSVSMNMTAALGRTPFNMGEIGARFDGLEPLLEELFGPDGYVKKTATGKIFEDISSTISEKFSKIKERLERSLRQRRSIDTSTLSQLFNKLYGDKKFRLPKADIYARMHGQEIAFASLAGDLKHVNVDELIERFFNGIDSLVEKARDINVNSVRTAQIYLDYHFPTIQGIPLKMKMEGTAVAGLRLGKNVGGRSEGGSDAMKFYPSVSTQIDGFIGFDFFIAKAGMKTENRIATAPGLSVNLKHSSESGFEIEVDLPEKMELLNVRSETFLLKGVRGHPDTKVNPSSVRSTRFQAKSCMTRMESALGVKICYDADLPNIFRSEGLPLGPPAHVKMFLEKSEPSMRGYNMKANIQNTSGKREIKLEVGTPGSSTPRKGNALIIYGSEGDANVFSVVLESQSQGGIKMELKNKWTQPEKMLELNAYVSRERRYSPDTKGVEAKFQMNDDGQEIKVNTHLRTLSKVKEYLAVNVEVDGDLRWSEMRIPVPRRLRKFEIAVSSERWNAVTFIHKASDAQFNSVMKLGRKGAEMIDLKGNHNVEGSSDHGFIIKSDISGKIRSSQYKSDFILYAKNDKIGTQIHILRQGDGKTMVEIEIIYERPNNDHSIIFMVHIPECMKKIKMEARAMHRESANYQIDMKAEYNEKSLMTVKGPVTAQLSSKLTHLQAQLQFVMLESEPFSVKTAYILAPQKQHLSLDLNKETGRIMMVEWSMTSQESRETKLDFKADLPSLIKKSVNVLFSDKLLHLSMDDVISPKSSNPLKLKGFFDVEFEQKKATCDFTWDSEEKKDNRFKADVALARDTSTLQNWALQGTWTYLERSGRFKTELRLADPQNWFTGMNNIRLEVTTPSQRTYHIDSEIQNELWATTPKMMVKMSWKTPESKEYKISSENIFQRLAGPWNAKIISKSELMTPEGQKHEILLEVQHQRTESQRDAHFEIQVRTPSMSEPVNMRLALDNQREMYSFHWKLGMGSPADIAMYELRLAPEGGVQMFKAEFKLEKMKEFVNSLNGHPSSASSGSRAAYLISYERPMSGSHSLNLHTPSRKMESEFKYSPSEINLRFHPRAGTREGKYELYGRRSSSRMEGLLSAPGLSRDINVAVEYLRDEHKITGNIELDIFSKAEDKITGKLESLAMAPNTVVMEAKLQGKMLKANPKLVVAAAYGPQAIGFDLKFHKSASAPLSLLIAGKLDMRFDRNAAISFIMKADERKVLDISGSVQPHQSPECYGILVKSKAQSSVIGRYDVTGEWCKPLMVRFFTKKHESDRRYVATVGMEGFKRIEISMVESYPKTDERRILGMARVKLLSPTVLMAETKYERDQLHNIKNSVSEEWSKMRSAAGSWMDNMSREVLKEGGASPSSQIANVWQEIKEEAKRIFEDLKNDGVIPSESFRSWLVRDVFNRLTSGYWKLWMQYEEVRRQISSSVSEAIRKIRSELPGLSQFVTDVVVGGARAMHTGEMPEGIRRMWNRMEESTLYRDAKEKLESMFERYPEDYQGFKQIMEKMQRQLKKDMDKQRRNLMSFNKPRQIVNWIMNSLNFERIVLNNVDRLIKTVIESVLQVPLQISGNHMKLMLPVRQPVYSLPQAVAYTSFRPLPTVDSALWSLDPIMPIPTDNLIWAYYSLLPRRARYVLPPFNRTAMVVDGTEIITFDRAVLKAPHSPCKVLLAQYKSESLVMQNQQPSSLPHLILKTSEVKVEVKPDFTVTMNGQPISDPHHVQGRVEVLRKAEKIEVRTPYIMVHVYQKSRTVAVEVSGWTYGQLAGLLGTYDGEMSNDWITPRGSRPSNMQELVKSWQEDQSCQTPAVSVGELRKTPMIVVHKCAQYFYAMRKCEPVIRPEPFMELCYQSKNPCLVARAYGALCAINGVDGVFPIPCFPK